ncbi:MAG: STAS domain-containing protein [Terriglobales bacterium]|jgi:anti-sigma B factor antagonist|nr:STAS domain-containing protein [Terriglobales bacterium]
MPDDLFSDALLIERVDRVVKQGILCLQGPMTAKTVSSFQNAMRNEVAPIVILDLTEVPYVDSAGLGSLVSAYISCHKAGRQVVLTGINSRILRLFEITRVESLFLMFPTLDDALGAFITPVHA